MVPFYTPATVTSLRYGPTVTATNARRWPVAVIRYRLVDPVAVLARKLFLENLAGPPLDPLGAPRAEAVNLRRRRWLAARRARRA